MNCRIENLTYAWMLCHLKGVGSVSYKKYLDNWFSAKQIWLLPTDQKKKIIPLYNFCMRNSVNEKRSYKNKAKSAITLHQKANVQIFSYAEEGYPKPLLMLPDAPSLLFAKNMISLKNRLVIGIVGTRRATAYGKVLTEQLIKKLHVYNPIIVSGLADGIDKLAHKTACNYNLSSIAVVAGGVDNIYPSSNHGLAKTILQKGGSLLSENPLQTDNFPYLFPLRNRIIAGLIDFLIITEAGEKSGALITARYAFHYQRPIFSPTKFTDKVSFAGNYKLIKSQKASPLSYLFFYLSRTKGIPKKINCKSMTFIQKKIVDSLQDAPIQGISLGELVKKIQLPTNNFAHILLQMVLKKQLIKHKNRYFLSSSFNFSNE